MSPERSAALVSTAAGTGCSVLGYSAPCLRGEDRSLNLNNDRSAGRQAVRDTSTKSRSSRNRRTKLSTCSGYSAPAVDAVPLLSTHLLRAPLPHSLLLSLTHFSSASNLSNSHSLTCLCSLSLKHTHTCLCPLYLPLSCLYLSLLPVPVSASCG